MTQLTATERETEALRKFVRIVANLDPEAEDYEDTLRRLIEDAQYLVRALRVPRTTAGGGATRESR